MNFKQLLFYCWIVILLFPLMFPGSVAAQTFTEVSQEWLIYHSHVDDEYMGGGAAIFDFNNDGFEDIFLTGGTQSDALFLNIDGTQYEMLLNNGLEVLNEAHTMGVAVGDINNDSYDDLLVLCGGFHTPESNFLFLNNGDNSFTDISESAGIAQDLSWSIGGTFLDFDLDGDLDIYVGNYLESGGPIKDEDNNIIGFDYESFSNNLYLNNGDLTFTDVASIYGIADDGCALAVAATDYDFDHDLDLYVANDFGFWNPANALFENNLEEGFSDVSVSSATNAEMFGMGIAVGDYDEDGDFDYYVTNIGPNVLFKNNGDKTFEEVGEEAGVLSDYVDGLFSVSWGTAFIDYDHDTWLDLFVSNGQIPTAPFIGASLIDPNKLYRNNRDGSFNDISAQAGFDYTGRSRGMAFGDLDLDGDLDMIVPTVRKHGTDVSRTGIYRNDLDNNHNWVSIRPEGVQSNRNAYGAKVLLECGARTFIREIDGGSSHCSRSTSYAHFGLADIELIDNARIIWPGGHEQVLGPLEINRYHDVLEDTSSVSTNLSAAAIPAIHFGPNPIPEVLIISPFKGELRIFDMNGHLVYQKENIEAERTQIDTQSWPRGAYIARISLGQSTINRKLLKTTEKY